MIKGYFAISLLARKIIDVQSIHVEMWTKRRKFHHYVLDMEHVQQVSYSPMNVGTF